MLKLYVALLKDAENNPSLFMPIVLYTKQETHMGQLFCHIFEPGRDRGPHPQTVEEVTLEILG